MEKRYLSPDDVRRALGIGRSLAYNLFHRADFPAIQLGRKLLVRSDNLDEWLSAQNELTKAQKKGTV